MKRIWSNQIFVLLLGAGMILYAQKASRANSATGQRSGDSVTLLPACMSDGHFVSDCQQIILKRKDLAGIANTGNKTMKEGTADSEGNSWLGLRSGFQSNGGSIAERWTLFGLYEYRFPGAFSLPVEFQFVRGEEKNFFMFSAAGKLRTHAVGGWNIYGQGGFGIGVPALVALHFHYALGLEILISDIVSVYANVKRTSYYPDLRDFISIGVNMKVSSANEHNLK
ncbi:MAG: hypothetical protein O7D34_01950 [Ignavibacteria bacterium]|nr:hypothetical protein [Ignavibacteria bacterium]